MSITLRPYQEDAIAAIESAWDEGFNRTSVVIATGGGKTTIFSDLIRRHGERLRKEGKRILVLAHRAELLSQGDARIKLQNPGLWTTLIKGSQGQKTHQFADVIVGSVQTLSRPKRREAVDRIGMVIVDECFPAGTLVGGRPIKSLQVGDLVPSWNESTGVVEDRRVTGVMSKVPSALVRVHTVSGRSFTCTPNHPVMTNCGWMPAGMLTEDVSLLCSAYESSTGSELHELRDAVRDREEVAAELLQGYKQGILRTGMRVLIPGAGQDGCGESDVERGNARKDGRDAEAHWTQAGGTRRERSSCAGTTACACGSAGLEDGCGDCARGRGTPVSLQGGHGAPYLEVAGGSGRGVPFAAGAPEVGRTPGRTAGFDRVDHVEVLEPGSDGTYGGLCAEGLVYNLEVEDNHTYLIEDGVVVHNCHNVSQGLKDILAHYGCMEDGGTPTVGFTATMTRMNGGLGEVWQSVAYQRKIHQLIKDGYLVAPKALSVNVPGLNLATTRVTAGDLNTKDLADALEDSAAFDVIAEVWQDKASERPTVAFMPNVATARRLAATLQQRDVAAEVIHGGMDKKARDGVYARYDSGATRVIVNVMCLTEGWDAPHTSCAIIGRPTLNPGLFIQMVGRTLRLHPGKKDALILDLAGASSRHTLAGVNDLESECEASCGCNCLSCGCNGSCKCALRRCGCSCIEAHGVNGRDCRCCGSDECWCGCIPEDEGGPGCLCADNPDCGCRGEGPEKEQKEVDASVLRNLVQVDILGESLAKSSYTWLDTPAGIKFLSFGPDTAAFLLPDPAAPGMYFQGVVRGTRSKAPVERVDSGSLPADAARKGLEELVSASGWTYSNKRASWRRTPASEAQLSLLRRYRPELPAGIKKGEASDMLSSFRFGVALDERFGKYVRRERETASGQAR